ncbi:P-loop ATPase [Acinetobacter pittii]|uniref:KAP family P-loop NTPase fold protein n=1 Tax=Acinetobacter TaxID=469 RepID=UPI00083936C2|nr:MULTISPECIES: P-loop NTPase fold protein [Acinetobacter]MBJ6352796.1 P-loop ATPase [Acinetobacter sp. c1]MBM0957557.1 P-loop ATPase [Acinetobacter sp. C13]MBN6535312.1 P-loop ATPase [Acinetobacter pittii]MZY07944.1 P-loop ATPase [Acinetobacter pittii]OCY36248.1 P-loop ATPase [Acinetobacter pittii]
MSELHQLNWNNTNLDNIENAWEGDLWGRKYLGERLTNYVDRLQCGAVLTLDARWGEGKTWFVKHWQKHLEHTDHNVIYLDAFANDYLDDPFLLITSEITNILSKDKKTKKNVENLIELSASIGTALLPSLPKVALTMGLHLIGAGFLGGLLQQGYENAKDEVESLTEEASDRIKESIQEKIARHEAEKKTLNDFKKYLTETVSKLDKPLVFIIDELDRCRPDFAIRLIERIKHFFDTPKIVFVLVMNKTQLLQSIKTFYGYDSEIQGDYLEKFVDFTIQFPSNIADYHYENIIKEQLFRVGELTSLDEVNELYFFTLALQLEKKLNARAFIRKINQFALLRTDNPNKNLILLSYIMGGEPFANHQIYIEKVINKLISYLCKNKREFLSKHHLSAGMHGMENISDAEWYRIILEYDYQVKGTIIDKLMQAYDQARRSSDSSSREYTLRNFLKDLAIYNIDHSNRFEEDWKSYIKEGL